MFEVLNDGVAAPGSGVGDRVHQIVQYASCTFADQVRRFSQGSEFRGAGGFHPVPQKFHGQGQTRIFTERVGVFFQCPRGAGLQVLDQQAAELRRTLPAEVLGAPQPPIFGAGQGGVPGLAELPLFLAADFVHGLVEMLFDMELVEDDGGFPQGLLHRSNIGGPPVHGHGLDAGGAAFGQLSGQLQGRTPDRPETKAAQNYPRQTTLEPV